MTDVSADAALPAQFTLQLLTVFYNFQGIWSHMHTHTHTDVGPVEAGDPSFPLIYNPDCREAEGRINNSRWIINQHPLSKTTPRINAFYNGWTFFFINDVINF